MPHAERIRIAADFSALIRAKEAPHSFDFAVDPTEIGKENAQAHTSLFAHLVQYGDDADVRCAYAQFQVRRHHWPVAVGLGTCVLTYNIFLRIVQARGMGHKFLLDFLTLAGKRTPAARTNATILFLLDQFEAQATRLVRLIFDGSLESDLPRQAAEVFVSAARSLGVGAESVDDGYRERQREWGFNQLRQLLDCCVDKFFDKYDAVLLLVQF